MTSAAFSMENITIVTVPCAQLPVISLLQWVRIHLQRSPLISAIATPPSLAVGKGNWTADNRSGLMS